MLLFRILIDGLDFQVVATQFFFITGHFIFKIYSKSLFRIIRGFTFIKTLI